MLHIVQLEDGCYRVTLDCYLSEKNHIHWERIFKPAESDAPPLERGEEILLKFGDE